MRKYTSIPAITGKELIRLLQHDDWLVGRKTTHGLSLTKETTNRTLVTVIKNTSESLPTGTLGAILGPKQTQIGKKGLLNLLNKYGL